MSRPLSATGTKARIRAAAAAVIRRDGVEGLTMRAIAKEVGVSPTALYRHYPNREAILQELWRLGYEGLASQLRASINADSAEERVLTLLERYVSWALQHPGMYEQEHLCRPNEGDQLKRGPAGTVGEGTNMNLMVLVDEIRAGIGRGELRADGVWEIALAIWGLAHGLVSLHWSDQVSLTDEELKAAAQQCMRGLLRGFRA